MAWHESTERPNLEGKYTSYGSWRISAFHIGLDTYISCALEWPCSPRFLQLTSSPQVPLRSVRVDRTRSSLWPELKVLETTLEEAVDFCEIALSARHRATPHTRTTHHNPHNRAIDSSGGNGLKMTEIYPSLTQCAVVATAFKILLFPA